MQKAWFVEVTVTDLGGRTVKSGMINQANYEIDLNELKEGVYLITIKNDSFIQTDRVILQ